MKIFRAQLYDLSEIYSKGDEWKRFSDAYVIADDLEKATKIANKNIDENHILTGINEMVDAKLFM